MLGLSRHLSLLVGVILWAGCGGSSPTTTPTSTPAAVSSPADLVFHDTMNPRDSRSPSRLWVSSWFYNQYGSVTPSVIMADDFTPTSSGELRSIRWQGGYCDARYNGPHVAPEPEAQEFTISIIADRNNKPEAWDFPPYYNPLYFGRFPPSAVEHIRLFEMVPNSVDPCANKGDAAISYYEHGVTLSTPFAVVAGRHYWLSISVNIGTSQTLWGWRVGSSDNGRSVSVFDTASQQDLAFRLSR